MRRSLEKTDSARREEKSKSGGGGGGGGGLFAPTKSWLQYLNERKGVNARREMSSSHQSKTTPDRSGSPQARTRAKQEETTTTEPILTEKKEASVKRSLTANGKRTTSDVDMKNSPKTKLPEVTKKITYPSLKRNTKKINKENKDVGNSSQTQHQDKTTKTAVEEDRKVSLQSKEGRKLISNGTARAASKVMEKVKSQISQVSEKKNSAAKVDVKKQSMTATKKSQSLKSSESNVTKSTKSALQSVESISTGSNGVTSKDQKPSANGDVILRQDNKNGSGYDLVHLKLVDCFWLAPPDSFNDISRTVFF